jgi:hypothetical protein
MEAAARADKIFLSVKVLIIIGIVYSSATIGVGLLTSLVNTPDCDDQGFPILQNAKVIEKRSLGEEPALNFDHVKLSKKIKPNNPENSKNLPRCEELNSPLPLPDNGTLWESLRLPDSVIPIRYNITLFMPIFNADIYSGELIIEIEAQKSAPYIILNAVLLAVYLPVLNDSNNNQLEIACIGDYLPNGYFVVKPKVPLEPGKRYKLKLDFTGYLNYFESGIFELTYNQDFDEFDG